MFGGLVHEPALTLARRLAALMPGDLTRVFFSDSGSVAVEVAMKMAVQYWLNRGVKGRTRFVAFKGGYHGDTTGAMSVCDPDEGMHALFSGLLPQQFIVDLPDNEERAAALDRLLGEQVPTRSPALSSSRWCRAPAACCFTSRPCCSACARSPTNTNCC